MKTPRVLVLSDLHADVRPFKGKFKHDYSDAIVLLPGDVCPLSYYRFESTITDICNNVRMLLFTPGNHEYYGHDIVRDQQVLVDLQAKINNFVVLDNKSIVIDGVRFIGSTLWTNMDNRDFFTMHACKNGMNDFWIIRNNGHMFTPDESVDLHNKSIAFIEEELIQSCYEPTTEESPINIVMTHHAPSYKSVIEKYKGQAINGGFASELSELILKYPIKYWIHGHMHAGLDYMIGDTRVICNPRGYNDKENPNFNPKLELIL